MVTYENIGLMTYIDEKGNKYIMYPITKAEAVEGLDDIICDTYSKTAVYEVGDYCIYENVLYRCTTAITTGESFNSAHWNQTGLALELVSHFSDASNPHNVTKEQVGLGNVPNVSTNNQTPTYTIASTLSALVSGETLSAAFPKIAKGISDLISHLANTSNPHSITKSQVGLGNVPNVATNDQTPTYSQASSLATLVSGEKLSVSMGKIMKAITDLISHLANKSNPHGVTKSQVGLGSVDNTADANKTVKSAGTCTGNSATATKLATARTFRTNLASTSTASFDGTDNVTPGVTGTLPVTNGGTGKASVTSGNFLVGNGTGAMTEKTPAQVLSAVGAAKAESHQTTSFYSLTTLGINAGDLSTTDFVTNVKSIMDSADTVGGCEQTILRCPFSNSSNMAKSIFTKMLTDLGYQFDCYIDLVLNKYNTSTVHVYVYPQGITGYEGYALYCRVRFEDMSSTSFVLAHHPDGFIPDSPNTSPFSITAGSGDSYSVTVTNKSKVLGDSLVQVCGMFATVVSASIAVGTSITLGTLSDYKPKYNTAVAIWVNSTKTPRYMGYIDANGNVIIKANEALIAGTYYFYINAMYIKE